MNKIHFALLSSSILLAISCSHLDKRNTYLNDVVAFIDTIPITVTTIDNRVKQELYDELCRIYLIRKIALQDVVNEKLLSLEALKKRIPVEELLDSLYKANFDEDKIERYIHNNDLGSSIPVFERTLKRYDRRSQEGNELLIKRYNEHVLKDFIDTLNRIYNVKILLQPPKSPSIDLNNFSTHFKTRLNSRIDFLIISDFECDECREANPIINSIYNKYKENINFGFLNFGSYVSLSALASEGAARQEKFWEMHDSIFALKQLPDTLDVMRIASNIGLDTEIFERDLRAKSSKDKLMQDYLKIRDYGIYATPTIVIGNNIVFNSFSVEEIEKLLTNALSGNKVKI